MPKAFPELRERLLVAGIAPRRVRRLLRELAEHHADLVTEGLEAGLEEGAARSAASVRLGGTDALARSVIGRPELQSWCYRAPWAYFGILPLLALGACYAGACLILWSGWRHFLPALPSPFVPVSGAAAIYFGAGRALFFGGPILVGWLCGLLAFRQRLLPGWPVAGMALVALAGSTAQVRVQRPWGGREVELAFALGRSLSWVGYSLRHAAILFALAALPFLAARILYSGRPAQPA